jgi:DNA-binding response OmpR family regulator
MIDLETKREGEEPVRRPKLLLADDSPTIRKVVDLTFADEGIDVTAVGEASSAMEEFVRTQPDIVLVDINLPGTSGYKICEMIKQDEATARIPVLLLVGSFEPFDQDEAERVAADGYLLKPFKSIRELVSRVKELLSQPADYGANSSEADPEFDIANSAVWARSESGVTTSEINDIENLYEQSFLDTAEVQDLDTVDDTLTDSSMDDELIETRYPSATENESPVDAPSPTNGRSYQEDETPVHSTVSGHGPETGPADNRPDVEGPDVEQGIERKGERVEIRGSGTQTGSVNAFEPSEEFIALVASRVIERLSGREIRDVAREVVCAGSCTPDRREVDSGGFGRGKKELRDLKILRLAASFRVIERKLAAFHL